ncbi:plasmid maintenance protein [Candidatus Borreliella tachyglossi]|uniref:plasmid maintenance protein n=1 Tax=Candidatus Borreliella tachyglossi TaxID=1964448 RepID=UPI0040437E66
MGLIKSKIVRFGKANGSRSWYIQNMGLRNIHEKVIFNYFYNKIVKSLENKNIVNDYHKVRGFDSAKTRETLQAINNNKYLKKLMPPLNTVIIESNTRVELKNYNNQTNINTSSHGKSHNNTHVLPNKASLSSNKKEEGQALRKYLAKCKFKIDLPLFLLDLNISKELAIELIKEIKKNERAIQELKEPDRQLLEKEIKQNPQKGCIISYFKNKGCPNMIVGNKVSKQEIKERKLREILALKEAELKEEYSSTHLRVEFEGVYETYKSKPHFILEHDKYSDLEKIICKIKSRVPICSNSPSQQKELKSNIFSILLDLCGNKVTDSGVLLHILRDFIDKQQNLSYENIVNNTYYEEVLLILESQNLLKHQGHTDDNKALEVIQNEALEIAQNKVLETTESEHTAQEKLEGEERYQEERLEALRQIEKLESKNKNTSTSFIPASFNTPWYMEVNKGFKLRR